MNPSIKSGDARTDQDLVSPHRPEAPAQRKSALKKKKVTGYDNLEEGDVIEVFDIEEIARTLDDVNRAKEEKES